MITVETANSTYVIDEESMTVVRETHVGEELRRDGEPIKLEWYAIPPLGGALQMQLDLRGDGVKTFRITSAVTAVSRDE